MKVVALVSGGKDSCYNMQLCQSHGHEIVALANLQPLQDDIDELDSFMYQTVGHQIVSAFAQCMGLPLYRRRIQGTPRAKDLRYSQTKGDEVEDLETLLRAVKTAMPEIGGVSTGAIASDYQRLRVENVCSRLGLVSLAFMWKQEQASLLQNMIDSGLQAILIKVAAMGLNPHKHLGKDLATMQSLLLSLQERYGCNVCGEGGEYETLTLDSPLFKYARIILDESTVQLQSPDTIAPVGFLHPEAFHLEQKCEDQGHSPADFLFEVTDDSDDTRSCPNENNKSLSGDPDVRLSNEIRAAAQEVYKPIEIVTNVNRGNNGFVTISCYKRSPTLLEMRHELHAILAEIERNLSVQSLGWADVLYVHLYLDNMKNFSAANEVYMEHITEMACARGVPSRSCVELPLARMGLGHVLVEVLSSADQGKKVLHVQSVSSWAPCCIGPYSQATYHQHFVHMAGQLGLDPPTMTLAEGGASSEMTQALRNCEAVGREFDSGYLDLLLSLVVYCSTAASREGIQDIDRVLNNFLSSKDCTDISHQGLLGLEPLLLFIQLPALPKGALVEVVPLSYAPRLSQDEYSNLDEEDDSKLWQFVSKSSRSNGSLGQQITLRGLTLPRSLCRVLTSCSRITEGDSIQSARDVLQQAFSLLSAVLGDAALLWTDVFVLRIYFAVDFISGDDLYEDLASVFRNSKMADVPQPTVVPVLGVGETPELKDLIAVELTASRW